MEMERGMANGELDGMKVAMLVTDGFERIELTEPRKALDEAGAETVLVSPKEGEVKAWEFTDWGGTYPVDQALALADAKDFDALVLPGGVLNPDKLRMDKDAVAFVRAFFEQGKPVAAICHGPWSIIEAGCAKGRRMASWPSLKTDVTNAGAEWVDEPVVVDDNLVTSRKPDDLSNFNREAIKLFGQHSHQAA
jgi:protease I